MDCLSRLYEMITNQFSVLIHRRTRRSLRMTSVHPLFSTRENAPYKYAIQVLGHHHLTPDSTTTTDDKTQAIASIGHLSWTGGTEISNYTGHHYLYSLVSMLKEEETPNSLKLQIIVSLSEICQGNKENQDLARQYMLIPAIVKFMYDMDEDEEIRKWCLHTLFFLLCNNEANQRHALEVPNFGVCILRGLCDNWDEWEYNEARELETMLSNLANLQDQLIP